MFQPSKQEPLCLKRGVLEPIKHMCEASMIPATWNYKGKRVKDVRFDAKDFKNEEPEEEIQAVFEVNVLLTVTPVNQPMTDDVSTKGTTELHSEVDRKDTEKDKEVSREETPWRSPSKRVKLTIYPCLDDFTLHIKQVLQGFEQLSDILSTVQRGMQGVEKHCQRIEKFCDMVETAMLTDIDTFLAGEKWSPQDIKAILAVHTESIRLMKRIETETRVNMILVRCHHYQTNCLPYPQALIFTIHSRLPSIVKKKNLELMEVIRGALKKLDKDIFTLEEFVEHLTFLSRISVQIPTLQRQYQLLIQLYSMAKEYQIAISPEELALYQHLVPSFQHLKSTVMICETKRDDNIFKFSVDLGKHLNQLRFELVLVKMKVNNPILLCSYTSPKVANEILQALSEEVAIYSSKAYSYTSYGELLRNSFSMKKICTVVRMKQGRGSNAAEVEAELSEVDCALTLRKMLWGMQEEWDKQCGLWRATTFELLNVDDLQNDVSRFTQTIYMLEKGLPENNIVPILKQKVMDFKLCLPIIVALRNPYLRDISTTATNEATLESILYKVIDLWRSTDFRLITHQSDTSTVKIIASADDIMAQLEESQTTIMSIKASRYAEPIKYLIDEWERKLNQFSHTLEEWVMCQKRWLHLEPIFSAGGIQRQGSYCCLTLQLPAEAKVFLQVDQSWKEIMRRTDDRPNALRAATAPGVLEMLQAGNIHLEKIQKCLEVLEGVRDYLESKRTVFARFYFLSNEELLDVLSQSKNPNAIQPHLAKCFSNIRHLDIQEHATIHHVVATIRSAEGETVTMPKNVQIRGPVEQWMGNVETAMYNTVKRQLHYDWHDSTSLCYVVHAQASFMYGYEYLGCSPRLVITPLTDRCWLTLTGALSLHLGGAPAGPSGTGKTETVKDLAKALGKFCLVLNCFDSLDYKMMGKLYSGMVQSGSWCCFDEFNCINVEVLSVIAAQLQSIKAAMHSHSLRFVFEGRDIRLNASCGFFITMNPGCGLTPEEECCVLICALQDSNLPKLVPEDVPLFKSIMEDLFPGIVNPKTIHPKLEIAIAKATEMLGFQQWPNQAEKVTQLYSQILARGGVMLIAPTGGGKTTVRLILQHALHLLPSLSEVHRRTSVFMQLAPSSEVHVESFTINPKCVSFGELYGQIDPNTLEWSDGLFASADVSSDSTTPSPPNSYQHNSMVDNWRWLIMDGPVDILWVENLNTVLDDNKTLCLANGERISLPDGIRFLFEVDTLSQATPATISRCAMVYMDPVDLGWKPYVRRWLSQLPRQLSREGRIHIQQLFDNSITQGLNFVKKHQKLLNIQIPEMSTTLSEEDIGKTSADIESTGKGYYIFPICRREDNKWFLQKKPEKLTILLGKLFVFSYAWAVGGVLNHLDDYEDSPLTTKDKSCHLVNVAHAFKNLIHELFEGAPCGVSLPAGNRMIFNYFVDLQTGAFVSWDELVPSTESLIRLNTSSGSESLQLGGVLGESNTTYTTSFLRSGPICSNDTVRYSFLMSLLLLNKQPVLLTGDSGVGKTILIQSILKKLQKDGGEMVKQGTILGQVFLHNQAKTASLLEDVNLLTAVFGGDVDKSTGGGLLSSMPFGVLSGMRSSSHTSESSGILTCTLQCTAHTSTAYIQAHVLQNLVKKGKNNLVLVFVDDLNMPTLDSYGAQPSMELIRQFIELQGVFDAKTLTWKGIQDVTLCAACAPLGGGRQNLSPRLLRHFSVLVLPHPSSNTMQHIFQVQLGKFFGIRDFSKEVRKCREALVSASITVYNEMCQRMMPTPAKYHYTFNLRDLSKVIQGLMQASDSELNSEEAAAYLFSHETSRVFHDRLVNEQDRELFYQILSNELHCYFKVSWLPEELMREPIAFGDFLDMSIPTASRIYKHLPEFKKIQAVLEECHGRHGRKASQFPMVFFREAVEHITRAARVFRLKGAHMMLIGLDGTGKEECVTLACHVSGSHLYRLSVCRNCSYSDFRDDLKRVFRQAGIHRKNTVLLITDSDIVKESVLEDLNCILKCGDVPGLFDNDEIDSITVDLKSTMESSMGENREEMYSYFIEQVQQRLHIVLALSPAGMRLRQFCWAHPALLSCCNIDWYSEWSREALLQVASSTYINSDDFDWLGQVLQNKVARVCVDIHYSSTQMAAQYLQEMRRPYYIVPSTFIEYIDTFTKMCRSEGSKLHNVRDRFSNGLSILSEATSLVTVMQEELLALGPQIEEKSKEIEILMEKLKEDSQAVEQVRAIVKMEEEMMMQETQIVHEYAEDATAYLNKVLPLLEKAVSALDALEKSDISEIRQQKPNWTTAKQLLGDPGFLKRLVSLDKDSLPEKVGMVSIACRSLCLWVLALEYYHNVYKIIEPKQKKVNVAQEALVKAESNLIKKQKRLSKIEEHQKALEDLYNASVSGRQELGRRKELTTNRVQRAASLISALSNEKDRWEKAVCDLDNKLQHIVGDVMVSSAFITYCGPLTADYRKAMVKKWLDFCHNMEIPVSPQYTFISAMTEKNQVRHWQNTGLPPDQNSTENAVIVKNGPHWPLLIDPQGQATRWICSMEGVRLRKMLASDPNYMKTVERAIRMGDAVLIQDVLENIDPCLQPILIKNLTIREGQSFIKIGDTEIEYNPNFRLYLATCLPNPHFLPAVCILVKLINFSVEYECLQEQLLSSVVSLQQPELELQHNQLLHTITADLFSLHELENRSLLLLQDTQGHILDDQDLVDNLKKSKVTSNEISVRVETAKDKEKEIDEVRKKYLPIANRGGRPINYMYQFSLDWFNDMYVKALQVATEGQEWPTLDVSMPVTGTLRPAGAKSLRRAVVVPGTCAPNMGDFNIRLLKMMNAITESIYKEVSLALFVDHQVVFSFLMCCNIMKTNKHNMIVGSTEFLPAEEWKIFLHSAVLASMMDSKRPEQEEGELLGERPDHLWLTDSMWAQCQYLSAHLPCFTNLYKSIQTNCVQWELFQHARNLYEFLSEPYAGDAGSDTEGESSQSAEASKDRHLTKFVCIFPWESLSGFQKIILIKILRPECLNTAVKAFVIEKMGSKYLEVGKISLREVYERCSANMPILFLLSPGMDPASHLVRLAQELRGSSLHLDMVSLGQGQGPRAEELIYKAQVLKGRWVFLQNCHLAASFMPRLQTVVNSLKWKGSDLDPDFRLWLSSEPDPVFPASILQRAIKIAVEPPRGLKEKLLHTFSPSGEVTERSFCKMDCSPAWKTLLFSLCFFNAIVQERKKYGPLGWNIPYTFTSSDLEVSMLNQERLLRAAEGSELPWAALRYLTGEVIYGGRVTDPWDRRCLLTILHCCYTPSVLQDGHSFCQAQGYPPFPKDASWPQCRAYIENMPDKDLAEVFGIDSSAEMVILQNQTQQLLQTIVQLQPRLSDSSLLRQTVPGWCSSEDGHEHLEETTRDSGGERRTVLAPSALLVILRQEIDRFNHLLCVVRSSLLAFSASIRGEVLMSEALEEVYTALLTMIVPSEWKHCSYESCKALGSWILDLEQRVWFFRAWADNIKINLIEKIPMISGGVYSLNRPPKTDLQQSLKNRKPRSYWLSGFFFPQGFLTAVLQNSARQKNVPVDSLSFTYHVQPMDERSINWSKVADKTKLLFEGPAPPDEGVLVYGLYLDGASWDPVSHTLQELQHNIKHCPVPEIHFLPCQVSDDAVAVPSTESPGDLQFYDCPLYRTFKRAGFLSSSGISTNFITAVSLPTSVSYSLGLQGHCPPLPT
ncbi:unnamed protein product [Coregonus sp. 'balchen']|nr:unnamed protein product [Coregonus sp. 'balchen']